MPDRGVRSRSRRLRIRILYDGVPIASDEEVDEAKTEDMPMERLILQARNSIFDEELYHELNREARNLTNQGVRCVGDAIILPYEADKQLGIDLVPLGGTDPTISPTMESNANRETPHGDDIIVKSIAISLRILLSYAHHQNLARRSQPPPPIRETKPPRLIYPILKPILEIMRHRSDVQSARTFLENLGKNLLEAKLNFQIEGSKISPGLAKLPSLATSTSTSATKALVNSLITPLRSSIKTHLPSNVTALKLELHTNFLPPTMGTNYQATIISCPPASPLANLPQIMHFSSPSALEDHILHILTLDLLSVISTNPATGSELTIASPHDGQLIRKNRARKTTQTCTILVGKERLSLEWRSVGGGRDFSRALRWGEGKEEGNGGKGLLEVIKEAMNEELKGK